MVSCDGVLLSQLFAQDLFSLRCHCELLACLECVAVEIEQVGDIRRMSFRVPKEDEETYPFCKSRKEVEQRRNNAKAGILPPAQNALPYPFSTCRATIGGKPRSPPTSHSICIRAHQIRLLSSFLLGMMHGGGAHRSVSTALSSPPLQRMSMLYTAYLRERATEKACQ